MNNLVPLQDITQMAEVAASSKMFGFKNPQEAMAIMLLCQAENLHPAVAMRDYHVIQGRPALKADAMLARFQQAGGSVNWKDYTDEKVTGVFSHPSGGSLEVSWSLAQAKSIGIANKDNWRNYPRAMLRARCVSEGIRSVYPGCVVGVYTPEEIQDFKQSKPIDMGIAERVEDTQPSEVIEDGAFPLYVPNADEPYTSYHTVSDWITGFEDMVMRISGSNKLDDATKASKIESLNVANEFVIHKFEAKQKLMVKAVIGRGGANPLPKPQVSQDGQELRKVTS
jgi:hypothetical protein